jgi:hypothetical protein
MVESLADLIKRQKEERLARRS